MLTDKELKFLFKLFNIKCKGIYLKDQLINRKVKPGFYIYNLDSQSDPVQSNSLGTHWTCSVGNSTNVFYFDSYGVVPPQEIDDFMKLGYEKYAYNNYIIQGIDAESCGHFCLAFALFIKQNQTKGSFYVVCNDFINMFEDNPKKNDLILRKYLETIAKKKGIYNNVAELLDRI